MKTRIILGGGIAGLSLASFLDGRCIVLEKENKLGGLCRSYDLDGIAYDVGPHIMFSKNKEVLNMHLEMVPTNQIRRSNQIYYKGRYVKYPFENDLAKLPAEDRDYCLKEFLDNPYEDYEATNMLQFFLKTFGEGITHLYLQPYNQKIWKFDPSCLDTQMVERIPKPPKEDVIASAHGVETEGYTHQLFFNYPAKGGFQCLVDAYAEKARAKGELHSGVEITEIQGRPDAWRVHTKQGVFEAEELLNCMPLHELFRYLKAPEEVGKSLQGLKYNSIHIVAIHMKKDKIGDHFALYFPDPNTIFHRLSRLNFLGESYCHPDGGSTLMAEVTFRPESYLGSIPVEKIEEQIIEDLTALGMIEKEDVVSVKTVTAKYAYVIYDLDHRRNADTVLHYLKSIGIRSAGRFAQFEYMNSDAVVESTLKLARELNSEGPV